MVSFAQKNISGTVKNQKNELVPYATITVGYGDSSVYAVRSNANGQYELQLKPEVAKTITWIEAKHIAYNKARIDYKAAEKQVDFVLSEKAIQIDDVVVKSRPRPITGNGDTTRYSMDRFVSAEDQNIGDVLRRMPGVEVDPNGVIKHNGKTVNRMYIDGDQLFQNGYGIGTRTIQPKSVKDVEIIKNHEHKKVKHGISNSEDVAINLILTEDAKTMWSGEGKVGIAAPLDPYFNVNAMSFKKKYKNLSTIQYNSTGDAISNDVENIDSYNLVQPLGAQAPQVPKNKYYDNRSFALNTNQLYKYSKDWNTNINANIWLDKELLKSNSNETYFLENDQTIQYNNSFNTILKPFYANGKWTIEGNRDTYFFKNSLTFAKQNQNNHSWLLDRRINDSIDQRGIDRKNYLSNSLEYIPKLKNKDLFSVNFNISKTWHQSQLVVSPGVMNKSINNNQPYDSLAQHMSLPQYQTNLRLTYTKTKTRLKRSYFIDGNFQQKNLETDLDIFLGDRIIQNNFFTDNNLSWRKAGIETGSILEWKKRQFDFKLSIPLSWNNWIIEDQSKPELDERKSRIQVSPTLFARYNLKSGDNVIVTAQYNQFESQISRLYRNPIVGNFRQINSNNAPLFFTENSTFSARYNFERPLNFFYANIAASYNQGSNDFLVKRTFTEQGISNTLIPFKNRFNNADLSFGISKSILKKGLYLNLNGNIATNNGYDIINELIMDTHSINYSLSPRLEYKKIKNSTLHYQYAISQYFNQMTNTSNSNSNSYTSQSHQLSILHILYSRLFLKTSWNYSTFTSNDFSPIKNGFVDFSARYKPAKSKHAIELEINNVLDKRRFESNTLNASSQTIQDMPLRGIQGMLKYSFIF